MQRRLGEVWELQRPRRTKGLSELEEEESWNKTEDTFFLSEKWGGDRELTRMSLGLSNTGLGGGGGGGRRGERYSSKLLSASASFSSEWGVVSTTDSSPATDHGSDWFLSLPGENFSFSLGPFFVFFSPFPGLLSQVQTLCSGSRDSYDFDPNHKEIPLTITHCFSCPG